MIKFFINPYHSQQKINFNSCILKLYCIKLVFKKRVSLKIIIFLSFLATSFSQKFYANINLTADRLTLTEKEELRYLPDLIKEYIERYNWFENSDDFDIKCEISIIITSRTQQSGLNKYESQILFNSPANENFYDKNFSFIYESGNDIQRNSAEYQYIGNVIDFYMYMIAAGELDTFGEFQGDPMYARASNTLRIGLTGPNTTDWAYRKKIYDDVTNPLAKPIRLSKFKYYEAKAYLEEKNYSDMRKTTKELISKLRDVRRSTPNNTALKRYFEGYYKGLIDILDPSQDQEEIQALIELDPVRKDYYSQFVEK
jgi:hypothetical protein